ncbi:MAG: amidohydrolase family protein [Bacteroidota bacterium]
MLVSFLGCHSTETSHFDTFLNANSNHEFSLLITNALVYDGSGSEAIEADVLLRGNEIAFVGLVDTSLIIIEKVIDAQGKVLSPGFIDAHAHGNPFRTPEFKNFLAMGVTSICLGQDGSSPARDIVSWINQVDSIDIALNIIPFVGHGTIRMASGTKYQLEPSAIQLDAMTDMLQEAFDVGCFGMSTGLEYTPGVYAQAEEMAALAKVVGKNDGIIMSHIRNEDDDAVEESLLELLAQGDFCNVHAAHLKVVYGKGAERADQILELLFNRESDYNITADVYPYTASYTGISIVFPAWSKPPNDYEAVKTNKKEELLEFLRNKIQQRNGPEATLFGTARYAGLTLAQLSKAQGRPYEEILMDIGPGGASGAYFIMNEPLQEKLYQHPKVMLSSDGSPTMRHPRGYGSFAKAIEEYVFQDSLYTLAEAIHKMTGLTAQTLGITDRGLIKAGYKADLLIFDPLEIKANATYPEPHQLASGFDCVIVNGILSKEKNVFLSKNAGEVLKKLTIQ